MKKLLVIIITFAATGTAMAQKAKIAPYDNTLNGQLIKPFKADTTWRTVPPAQSLDKFFKQEDLDYKGKMYADQFHSQMPFNNPPAGYKMPNMMLQGNSKMPVVRLEGNSKMPVMGKGPAPKNNRDSVVVIP